MIPLTVLQFLNKYKHQICYPIIALAVGTAMWYSAACMKDKYWKNYAAQQQSQIVQLQQKITADDTQLTVINVQLTKAQAQVAHSDQVATTAQKQVDILLAKYEPGIDTNNFINTILPNLPTMPTVFVDLPACEKEVVQLQTDMQVMLVEIKADRTEIVDLKAENTILDTKTTVLVNENGSLKQEVVDQTNIIAADQKQIQAEQTKTKIWKRIAIGAGIAIAALLL